jgi:hypothetical protein
MQRWKWYKKWHEWRYHSHVHFSILIPYLFIILSIVLFAYNKATFADEVTTTWDFSNPSSFIFDPNYIEASGSSAQLKEPYSATSPTVSPTDAIMTSGIGTYTGFTTDETPNGGSITYRLSDNNGSTWMYWNGADWATIETLEGNPSNTSNSAEIVNNNISNFPITFGGIKWQALLNSDGNQQVILNSVAITADSDTILPDKNADNIVGEKIKDGPSIDYSSWTNGSSPYFSWDAGSDGDSGILGYCLYLGQDNSADITTTSGMFGNSPVGTGGHCQYITSNTSINLATPGILSTPLVTSTDPYYLFVSAIDKAGNMLPPNTFSFSFDNTPPVNPSYFSGPSTFINNKYVTLTWDQSAGDADSGIAGLQYNINNTGWYGETHNGLGDMSDLLDNDGQYSTVNEPDLNNIHDGVNVIYFRTWDNAGNATPTLMSVILKVNTSGFPSEPQSLTAHTINSSTNSFSFDWTPPTTFYGDVNNLDYCYTVNTLPSVDSCNYTGTGVNHLSAGPYATQNGSNTLYIVARDEANNINYDTYSSVSFSASTSAPGLVRGADIADLSVKATSNWRLAVTWDTPQDVGIGISNYKIYRSLNGTDYSLAGTSTSSTYVDSGLVQREYHYRVAACDSTNNCSANSPSVSMTPTGKFTAPANLIGQPETGNITTKRARIQWTTDRASDSKVLIGTSSGKYGSSEVGSPDQISVHQIDLDNLAAGTTYYYKVKWTDIDKNTDESQEYMFTTKPAPVVKEIHTIEVSLSGADIGFTSIGSSKVSMSYGESDSFGVLKSINTSPDESTYNIDIYNLKDGTKYYYQLSTFDSDGNKYDGNIFSFTTPPRPRISNLRFQPIEGQPTSTQSISWVTNVPTTSTVTYGVVGTDGSDIQMSALVTDHKIVISNLQDDSNYFLTAQSRDANGNLAVSDKQIFKTALDTRPPTVSDVNIESSIRGTGIEARGQVVVSWKTDEPATSQVGYADGSTATVFSNKTSEDAQLTTEHTVVLSGLPTSKVYSVQAISYDKARNIGLSEPQTAIIGHANESVLTVILNALQRVFGL